MQLETWFISFLISTGVFLDFVPNGLWGLGTILESGKAMFIMVGGFLGFVLIVGPCMFGALSRAGQRFNPICGGIFVAIGAALPLRA